MTSPEDRRREAPDGPEDDGDMQQDVNIHRVYLPPLTARVVQACMALIVLIAAWGGTNIELMRRDMADQNREQNRQNAEVLVQIASIKGDLSVTNGDVRRLESRTEKLEGRR
jgi:hypothetical protein